MHRRRTRHRHDRREPGMNRLRFAAAAVLSAAAFAALAVETVRINPAINPPTGTVIHGSAELEASGTSVVRAVDGKELSTKRISQMDREEYVDTTLSHNSAGSRSSRVYGRVL